MSVVNDVPKGQWTARNTKVFKCMMLLIRYIWLNIIIVLINLLKTTESVGEMSMVFSVTCIFFLLWMMLLKCFFRDSFLNIIKDIDNIHSDMQFKMFKVESLL